MLRNQKSLILSLLNQEGGLPAVTFIHPGHARRLLKGGQFRRVSRPGGLLILVAKVELTLFQARMAAGDPQIEAILASNLKNLLDVTDSS